MLHKMHKSLMSEKMNTMTAYFHLGTAVNQWHKNYDSDSWGFMSQTGGTNPISFRERGQNKAQTLSRTILYTLVIKTLSQNKSLH